MELMDTIQPGLADEVNYLVEHLHTASQIGSGALSVLSTPSMIGFMERTCHQLIARYLPANLSSVGVYVAISHLAPTPVASTVKVRCEILRVDGTRVTLRVQAWDEQEKIGEGEHQRIIIDQERFLKRVGKKIGA